MGKATTSFDPAEGGGHRIQWRDIGFTSVVCVVLVVLAGAAVVVYPWASFQRLDVDYLIPWAAGMAILRSLGASGAALVACLYVTALLHGHGRRRGPSARSRTTTALLAAAAVPVLYAPVTALAMGSAMSTAYLGLGLRPMTFFHLVGAADVGQGLVTALIMGAIPALWSIAGIKLLSSRRRGMGLKLFVTWMFVVGLSLVLRIGTAIVE